MKKLLVVTLLVALLALSAESFRVSRQVDEAVELVEEVKQVEQVEQGTLSKLTDKVKSFYRTTINTASDYLQDIKGLKLEEKAKNLYTDASTIASTYTGIAQDQLYHFFYSQQ